MDAAESGGTLTTRPIRFRGKHLFVNLAASQGELRVEVLDEQSRPIAPLDRQHCRPVSGDSTRQAVTWEGANDLSAVVGKPVLLRFHLTRCSLYACWVTPDAGGASFGYVAGGGPGLRGPVDVPSQQRLFAQQC